MLRRSRWPLVAFVILALAVRVGFLLHDPHPYSDSGLAADSAEVARQIDDHGRWFESNLPSLGQLGTLQNDEGRLLDPAAIDFRVADAHPQYQAEILQPVGESVVLAAIWKITGEHWLPYQLLMIVIGSLLTLVVFYIALSLFGRRPTAYAAAALYAAYPPVAWLTTIPHLDAWAVDWTLVIAALLVRAREVDSPMPWLVATGVAVGLGTYFRPGVLLIAPFVTVALLSRVGWRRALRFGAIPTLIAALLLVPWTIRNENAFHRFIPTRIGVGQALWEGLGELPNNFGAVLDDGITYNQVHAVRPHLVYGSPAYDSFLESWGITAIRNHPGFYVRLMAKRLVDSTALLRNTDWAGTVLSPGQSGLSLPSYIQHRFTSFLAIVLEPFLFLVSIITIVFTRRRYGREHLFLVAIVIATLFPYLFLHLEPRYILPASFAYLIWTALGLDLLIAHIRRRGAEDPVPDSAGSAARRSDADRRRQISVLLAPRLPRRTRPLNDAKKLSYEIRRLVLDCSKEANVGHIGSSLSIADIVAALYADVLKGEPDDADRDRFILSKGHAALALYAALVQTGTLERHDLDRFCGEGTELSAHPEHALIGVDFATGSLGHGLSYGTGAALAARLHGSERRVFVLLSDAECNEGSVWEAAMFSAHHRLANLVAIVDVNGQQALGKTRDVLDMEPLFERWGSFGWDVHDVDGHDTQAIGATVSGLLTSEGAPHVLLARTTFGKGVSYMEDQLAWHYWPMSDDQYRQALDDVEASERDRLLRAGHRTTR